MPIYCFAHPKTKKTKEVLQEMNEPHVYFEKGIEWERIWTVPNAAIDSGVSMTSQAFIDKSKKKKGTLGDLYDQAQEASNKRAQERGGTDPVRKQALIDWGKKRAGRKHPQLKND